MRLIDLDNPKVMHLLCNLDRKAVPGRELNNEDWFEELGGFIEELLEIADEEPIDSVSVVRCADCEMSEKKSAGRLRCKFWRNGVMKDWYCFEGKKRRNEDATD